MIVLQITRVLRTPNELQPTTNYGCGVACNFDHLSRLMAGIEILTQYQTPCIYFDISKKAKLMEMAKHILAELAKHEASDLHFEFTGMSHGSLMPRLRAQCGLPHALKSIKSIKWPGHCITNQNA
jgi:hypothetical protein